jgi:hypothetical protein
LQRVGSFSSHYFIDYERKWHWTKNSIGCFISSLIDLRIFLFNFNSSQSILFYYQLCIKQTFFNIKNNFGEIKIKHSALVWPILIMRRDIRPCYASSSIIRTAEFEKSRIHFLIETSLWLPYFKQVWSAEKIISIIN